jgi:hypothetical protein
MPKEYTEHGYPTKYVWRKGKPYITENMNQHVSSRGSGRYGSGLYAYRTAHRMLGLVKDPQKDWKDEHTEPYCQLDVTRLNFFHPTDYTQLEELSDKMNDLAWNLHQTSIKDRTNTWIAELVTKIEQLKYPDPQLVKDGLRHIDKIDIFTAITKTAECMDTKNLCECSQPINHLLIENEFDGVEPNANEADNNHHGIVIFQEKMPKLFTTKKTAFCGKQSEQQEIIGKSKKMKTIGTETEIYDDPNPNYEYTPHEDIYECQIISPSFLEPIIEQEKTDLYLQIMQTVPDFLRNDYTELIVKAKKKENIDLLVENDRIYGVCTEWDHGETVNCQKLKEYWKEELQKVKNHEKRD